MNKDSTQLQQSLDEKKVGLMATEINDLVFQKYNPSNADIAVLTCYLMQMMLMRALETKTDYPKKMQIQAPTQHLITVEVKKPTASLEAAKQLLQTH